MSGKSSMCNTCGSFNDEIDIDTALSLIQGLKKLEGHAFNVMRAAQGLDRSCAIYTEIEKVAAAINDLSSRLKPAIFIENSSAINLPIAAVTTD